MNKKYLPNIDTQHPDINYDSIVSIGRQIVDVDTIVGGNGLRFIEYKSNWEPIHPDNRYKNIFDKVKNCKSKTEKEHVISTIDGGFSPIDLICFNYGKKIQECFVESDGHRRVSIAHMFNLDKIQADVHKYS